MRLIHFITGFFVCLLSLTATAQTEFFIEGNKELCRPGCEEYNIVALQEPNIFILEFEISVTGPNSTCDSVYYIPTEPSSFGICYYCPGTYQVRGNFFASNGQILQDSFWVFVSESQDYQIISVDSLPCDTKVDDNGCRQVCAGATKTYKLFPDPKDEVQWQVTGASSFTSNGNELTVVWGQDGFGNISTFGSSGCPHEAFFCANIQKEVKAEFTLTNTEYCVNENIGIELLSLDGASYSWDFGNGEVSNEVSPNFAYDAPGSYTISLNIITECGCKGSFKKEVTIKDQYLPTISCKSTICENTEVTYETTSDCGTFTWSVIGDGIIKAGGKPTDKFITIAWGKGPAGFIELEVDNCNFDLCPKKAVFEIPIISDEAIISGKLIACLGSKEVYAIQKFDATDYQWQAEGGIVTAGQGNHTVIVDWSSNPTGKLSVDYNNCYLKCSGSDQQTVLLKDTYKILASHESLCVGDELILITVNKNGSAVIVQDWKVEDQSGNILTTSNNISQLTVIVPNGVTELVVKTSSDAYCNEDEMLVFKVFPKTPIPSSIAGEANICKNTAYQYAIVSSLPQAEFYWKITDGSNITNKKGRELVVEWSSNGPYILEASQLDLSGQYCVSEVKKLQLSLVSNVDLQTGTNHCLYDQKTIIATKFEGMKYKWSVSPSDAATFIDDTKDSLQLIWSKTGSHAISLETCAGTFTTSITVNDLPTPVVNHVASLCEGTTTLVGTSVPYLDYEWKKENVGIFSTNATPQLGPGTYVVRVKDNLGCYGNQNFTIENLPAPVINISSPQDLYACSTATPPVFPTLYAVDEKDGYAYEWFYNGLGNGVTANIYTPNQFGDYSVKVTNLDGCTNLSNTLTVVDICDAVIEPDTIKPCNSAIGTINFSFTNLDCNTVRFESNNSDIISGSEYWYFEDFGPTDYTDPLKPVHVFTKAGYYKVQHAALVNDTENTGQTCTKFSKQIVEIPLKADFSFSNGCAGEMIDFFDLSTFIAGKTITTWSWDFGDVASGADNTSSLPNPIHVYNNEGDYTVKLVISDGSCTSSFSKIISLYKKPWSTISFSNGVCEKENLTILIDSLKNDIFEVNWNFDDITSGSNNIQSSLIGYHNYTNSGNYNISTEITSIYGCTNTLTTAVNIVPNTLGGQLTSSLGSAFCEGLVTTINAPNGGSKWLWNTNETTNAVSVLSTGIYQVTLTDANGCSFVPDEIQINVLPKPTIMFTNIVYDDNNEYPSFDKTVTFCQGKNFKTTLPWSPDYWYTWSTSSNQHFLDFSDKNGNSLIAGNYSYFVTVTDKLTNCANVGGPLAVTVNGLAAITITASTSGVLCSNTNHTLSIVNPSSDYKYTWNNSKKTTSILVNDAGKYFVKGIDPNGCENISNTIEVENGPDISLVPSGCFERCAPDSLCFPTIPNVVTYQWFKENTALSPALGGQNPYIILTESGSYSLQMLGTNGCISNSNALDLTLKNPVGIINGKVYSDVNGNNIVDPQDTLVNGIVVKLLTNTSTTNLDGEFRFENVPAGVNYPVIDRSTMPLNSKVIIDSLAAKINTCDDSVNVSYLVGLDCFAKSTFENRKLCFGTAFELDGQKYSSDTTLVVLTKSPLGCIDTSRISLDFTEKIDVVTNASPACPGVFDGAILVNTPTNEVYTFFLNNTPVNVINGKISNLNAFTYELKVKDSEGCFAIFPVTISEKQAVEFELETTAYSCRDGGSDIIAKVKNYDLNDLTFVWSNGATDPQIKAANSGNYGVKISNGCADFEKSLIFTGRTLNNKYQRYIVCSGNSLPLLDQIFSKDTVVYRFITNAEGCEDTTTYELNFGQKFKYELDVQGHCAGQNNGIIGIKNPPTGAIKYLINNQEVALINGQIGNLAPGEYLLTVADPLGCKLDTKILIEEREKVIFDVVTEELTCFKGYAAMKVELKNVKEDHVTINWSNGDKGVLAKTTSPGNFEVNISNGCDEVKQSLTINTSEKAPEFKLPGLLNPQFSDVAPFINLDFTEYKNAVIKKVIVSDRVGRQMFTSSNVHWLGPNQLPEGIYFYTIEAEIDVCGKLTSVRKTGKMMITN